MSHSVSRCTDVLHTDNEQNGQQCNARAQCSGVCVCVFVAPKRSVDSIHTARCRNQSLYLAQASIYMSAYVGRALQSTLFTVSK